MKQYKINGKIIKAKSLTDAIRSCKDGYNKYANETNVSFLKEAIAEMRRYERNWDYMESREKRNIAPNGGLKELRENISYAENRLRELQNKKDSITDASSDLTNIKVLKKERYKDFDDGREHTFSLVEYVPQAYVDDGSYKKLWAVIRDYNGEKVWTKGAIIGVSLRIAEEDFQHQLELGKKGYKAYLRGDSVEDDLGSDVSQYQKWVDYDMERYHKISGDTMHKIKKAGLDVVKDRYGDYEVIAHSRDGDIVDDDGEDDLFYLSKEEEQAIDDYKKAIANTKNPSMLRLFSHILKEEIEHLEELSAAKEGEFEDSIEDSGISETTKNLWYKVNEKYGDHVYNLGTNGLGEIILSKGYGKDIARGEKAVQEMLKKLLRA